MLKVENISKSFGSINALKNVGFSLKAGEIVTLFGANGAGKSTLMKTICGTINPDSGSVSIFGYDNQRQRQDALENLGYMPENNPIYGEFSVLEFLVLMARIKKVSNENITEIINKLSLQNVKDQKIETLSKGYKSRTAIGAALLANPKVLILDEPTEGLDPNQKKVLRDILKEYAKKNIVMISTHIIEEAQELESRILILNEGKLVCDTSVLHINKSRKNTSFGQYLRKLMEKK